VIGDRKKGRDNRGGRKKSIGKKAFANPNIVRWGEERGGGKRRSYEGRERKRRLKTGKKKVYP